MRWSVTQVQRIVLVPPAVEAGERLGFLPGDLAQKVDPYLRPLYDALYDLMGFDKVAKLLERGTIELAPLAYMRGRTLNHAFIILDEAQNTTPEQMKMFLTRIGFGAKAVVTGDVTQIDLARGQKSGLVEARAILSEVRGIAFTAFQAEDVVRHPLVARIINAYEEHEQRSSATPARARPAVVVQYASRAHGMPAAVRLTRWVRAAAPDAEQITVRLVTQAEGRGAESGLPRQGLCDQRAHLPVRARPQRRHRSVPGGDRPRSARTAQVARRTLCAPRHPRRTAPAWARPRARRRRSAHGAHGA
jgi:hypothetical protein